MCFFLSLLVASGEKISLTNNKYLVIKSKSPFPHDEFQAQLDLYANAGEVIWSQEEPGNQGAWHRIQHYVLRHMRPDQVLGYAMRASSASPAVGYLALHNEQQKELLDAAFAPLTDNLVLPVQGTGRKPRKAKRGA